MGRKRGEMEEGEESMCIGEFSILYSSAGTKLSSFVVVEYQEDEIISIIVNRSTSFSIRTFAGTTDVY